jgi:hypothetical protein
VFDQLSSLRNVIVHNAGLCDAQYLEDQRKIDDLPVCEVKGDKVKIDGKYAGRLISLTYIQCSFLVSVVDAWVMDH